MTGRFNVDGVTSEGHHSTTSFVDAPVEMPIMAVSEVSDSGAQGCDVRLGKKGGTVTDIATRATSRVWRRRGVYFLRLYVPKSQTEGRSMGFVRPATP